MPAISPQDIGSLQSLRDFSGGQINEVVDALLPENTMRLIQNMDTDVVGALRVRSGTTAIGNQIQDNKVALGLYNFRDSGSGSNSRQIAFFNNAGDTNTIGYYNSAGTWTQISGASFSANAKVRFTTFADYVFFVTSAFSSPQSWNGDTATSLGSTHLSSAPSGQFINVFKSRLYIAGTSANPDRVSFSSIISSAGVISWVAADGAGSLDVNPSDGMNITGLANTGTLLLIFKERAMYRWNGSSTDANLVVDVGTTSQESIATRNGIVFFFNPYGIYVTSGGYPQRISKSIQRWIDAISGSYYDDVAGVCDDDHYYCSIGDVTVDGIAYSNVVLVYTISSRTWTVRTYPEQIRLFANYINSSSRYSIMAGNDDGDVLDFNVGSTDAGVRIPYRVQTKRLDFGAFAFIKRFSQVFMFVDKLPGATTYIQVDDGESVAERKGIVGWFMRFFGHEHRGRYFVLEVIGESVDGQGELHGWEITDLTITGYI